MKHLAAACLALASLPAQSGTLDCTALQTSAGPEPAGYAQQCQGRAIAAKTAWPGAPALLSGEPVQAYAAQINPNEEFVAQGLYGFTLPDFAAATRIGTTSDTPNMFGMDFNSASTRLYGAQFLANNAGIRLGTFNLETGAFNALSFLSIGGVQALLDDLTGLAIHPRTAEAWVSTHNPLTNNPQLSEARLWRLDLNSGTVTFIGEMLPDEPNPVFADITVNCDGQMYAHNLTDDSIYRVDTDTALATRVGAHGQPANFAQGIDFDNATGQLYGWIYTGGGANSFGEFDLDTGAFTELATGQTGQWEGAIAGDCPSVAIEPEAVTGAWFAPYTNGQGFTLRYYPEAGTLFMPWFTFSVAGGDESDEQRWYSLFGALPEGATQVDLPILLNVGGNFDAPPIVPVEQVGQARLSFYSCSEGVLEYQFDPAHNGGAQGRLTMSRLLPTGADCTDFDGETVEAESDYDTDISGSWYDPETAGQGLELFRVARTDDDFGLFYGAWFTYEPSPADAGPAGQRWFTLSGQTVDEDGVLTTSIVRNLSGSFDNEPSGPAVSVGEVTLTSEACDRLVMTYEFDDLELVGEFRALTGEIQLRRLGGCAPTPDD